MTEAKGSKPGPVDYSFEAYVDVLQQLAREKVISELDPATLEKIRRGEESPELAQGIEFKALIDAKTGVYGAMIKAMEARDPDKAALLMEVSIELEERNTLAANAPSTGGFTGHRGRRGR